MRHIVPNAELGHHGLSPRDSFHMVVRGGSPLYGCAAHRVASQQPWASSHSLPKEGHRLDNAVRLALQATRREELGRCLAAKLEDVTNPDRQAIYNALVPFSSPQVAADEFMRSCEYLGDLAGIHEYLQAEVDLVVVFLPQNLPLYSFILFVVVPALQAKTVVFHIPSGDPPDKRSDTQLAQPAYPVYQTVFTHLSRLIWQVVRQTFHPTADELPTCRLRSLWRGGRVQAHPQLNPMRLELDDFGTLVHDQTLFAGGQHGPDHALLEPGDRETSEVKEALAACQTAAYAPGNPEKLYAAGTAARRATVACLGKKADVVIFTGSSSAAQDLRKSVGDHGLLLVNGSGYNPVVVGPQPIARIPLAVKKIVDARLFHNGQDCAAPDAILVESSVSAEFIRQLKETLLRMNPPGGRLLLPLISRDKYNDASKFITSSGRQGSGRKVEKSSACDANTQAIEPTIIVQHVGSRECRQDNFTQLLGSPIAYKEFYAPIFYVLVYREDSHDLAYYFNQGTYHHREMYVSCFGECGWVNRNLPRSVKLQNETVFDIDKGTRGYGGLGTDSTYAVHAGSLKLGPIQIPREISLFYRRKYRSLGEQHRSAIRGATGQVEREARRESLRANVDDSIQQILIQHDARHPFLRASVDDSADPILLDHNARRASLRANVNGRIGQTPTDDNAPRASLQSDVEGEIGRILTRHNGPLKRGAWLKVKAAFLYGPIAGLAFAGRDRVELCGESYGGCSDRIRLLVITDRMPADEDTAKAFDRLKILLRGNREARFNRESGLVIITALQVNQVLKDLKTVGADHITRLLVSPPGNYGLQEVHLVEALASRDRLWCTSSGDGAKGTDLKKWGGAAAALYGRWQKVLHNRLAREGLFASVGAAAQDMGPGPSAGQVRQDPAQWHRELTCGPARARLVATARSLSQPQDIVVSDVLRRGLQYYRQVLAASLVA